MAKKSESKKVATALPVEPEKKNIELHALHHEFYLAHQGEDDEGPVTCFSADPMTEAGRARVIADLASFIVDEAANGHATNDEPVIVAVYAASLKRTAPFNITSIEKAQANGAAVSVRDGDGFVVEILRMKSKDAEFPLIGVVFDEENIIIENRQYSLTGVCIDGVATHNLREYHEVKIVQPKGTATKGPQGK